MIDLTQQPSTDLTRSPGIDGHAPWSAPDRESSGKRPRAALPAPVTAAGVHDEQIDLTAASGDEGSSDGAPTDDSSSVSCGSAVKRRSRSIHCGVCLESVQPAQVHTLSGCLHHFCRDCLASLVRAKISNRDAPGTGIACPDLACTQKLQIADVRQLTLLRGDRRSWTAFAEGMSAALIERELVSGEG